MDLYMTADMEISSYCANIIYENEDFVVSSGNSGAYLIIRGKKLLDGIRVYGDHNDHRAFCDLPEQEKDEFLWRALLSGIVTAGAGPTFKSILNTISETSQRIGRNDVRHQLTKTLTFE